MTLFAFPPALLRERAITVELTGRTISPGVTASGVMPLARTDGGGLWRMTFRDIPLWDRDRILAWRALAGLADGGVNKFAVPFCDKRYMPAPIIGGAPVYRIGQLPHDDGSYHDDGAGYAQPAVVANIDGAAALRATAVAIAIAQGTALRGGEHFSIDHRVLRYRLYRIVAATDLGGGTYACTIRPPLREALVGGEALDFDEPKCVMQLTDQGAMDLELEQRRRGQPSVTFIEAFE